MRSMSFDSTMNIDKSPMSHAVFGAYGQGITKRMIKSSNDSSKNDKMKTTRIMKTVTTNKNISGTKKTKTPLAKGLKGLS